ncbi:MAG: Major facilitator superfamily MFS_1 [Methanomicrobiales archaeon 53_19]|nr:MAG: Major facilitator superfamily MFS_1 [Methanocalculus sp. 52_23]KUL04284.1 MAG: Major facilitator superfamily MFS_1 [Methanomicrobiales archaeon 53_19]
MVAPVAMAYVADLSPPGRDGFCMYSFNTSLFLRLGYGPLIGGTILDAVGIEMVFLLGAALSSAACIRSFLLLPDSLA